MDSSEQDVDDVIDLTEARDRWRQRVGANRSGLHRSGSDSAPGLADPAIILDRPAQRQATPVEPAVLRRSLFDSGDRVISSSELELKPRQKPGLGKPHGSRFQRLLRRR